MATMCEMNVARTRLQQMPPWARLWPSALLLLGVLSMHTAIASDEGGLIPHHETISVAQSVDVPSFVPLQGGASCLSAADCGGMAMVCLAVIAAAGAYVVLRGRVVDRVLRQLPSQPGMTYGRPSGPFELRSPRERSSVLRR